MSDSFDTLGLEEVLLRAVKEKGYTVPTPIQAQAIPPILEGRDMLGIAQTGTGKTAAFALPILQRLGAKKIEGVRKIRCLVLSPTRELAAQIAQSFHDYGRFTQIKHAVMFGGVGQQPQVDALRRGIDVLVATPGRLLDLMQQGYVKLDAVEIFVLDEADQMLDMGFIHDVRKVIAVLPKKRQNLLFSATMPTDIASLADQLLHNRAIAEVAPQATVASRITQRLFFVEHPDKKHLLVDLLQQGIGGVHLDRALVFTRTKHGANKLAKALVASRIESEAIHGNKSQSARTAALKGFKDGRVRVLVATDIAARGLDIDALSFVVNYDLSDVAETFVHRIGRTARAGASGIALAFCARDEAENWVAIERLMGAEEIERLRDHAYHSHSAEDEVIRQAARRNAGGAPSRRPPPHQSRGPRPGGGGFRSDRSSDRSDAPRPPQGHRTHSPRSSAGPRPHGGGGPQQHTQGPRQPSQGGRPPSQGPRQPGPRS